MNDSIIDEQEITYKFILVGDTSTGKTCIFKKLAYDKFEKTAVSTIGMDLKSLDYEFEIEENGKKIKKNLTILLHDSAGQTRFRDITTTYLKKSNGIILVYDITSKESFDNINEWIKIIEKEYGNFEEAKTCLFLIGNKIDLVEDEKEKNKREVETEDAKNLAKKCGLIWGGEWSALNNSKSQFEEIFIKFAKIIYSKFGYEEPDKGRISLDRRSLKKKKNDCKC